MRDLHENLANALRQVVPEGVAVNPYPGGGVEVKVGRSGVCVLPLWDGEPTESFARNVLRNAQDIVIEYAWKRDWPPLPEGVDESPPGVAMREPHAEVVGGELHWWYGDPGNPVLRLPPVPVG